MQKIHYKFPLHILHSWFWPPIKPQGHISVVIVTIFKLPHGSGFGQNKPRVQESFLREPQASVWATVVQKPEMINQPSSHDWQQKHSNLQGETAAEQ